MNPHITHQHTASKKQPATNHHTVLNRRTLLTGIPLITLSTLLTACTQQAAHEAASTETPTIASGESATASSTPASATTSPTPSPVVTRGYSGGSKAPEGEYRKADGYGPAQNVKKPRSKPKQYPETFAGLRDMMQDWITARNYGIQTGDMQYVWPYMLDTFDEDIKFLHYIEDLYKSGGWVIEGTSEYQAESDLMYDEKAQEYWVLTRRIWTYGMYINPNGTWTERSNTGNKNEIFMFRYRYKNGYWVLSEHRSNKELREQGVIK